MVRGGGTLSEHAESFLGQLIRRDEPPCSVRILLPDMRTFTQRTYQDAVYTHGICWKRNLELEIREFRERLDFAHRLRSGAKVKLEVRLLPWDPNDAPKFILIDDDLGFRYDYRMGERTTAANRSGHECTPPSNTLSDMKAQFETAWKSAHTPKHWETDATESRYVCSVAVLRGDSVLLLRRAEAFRVFRERMYPIGTTGAGTWEFPGGVANDMEAPHAAAARELWEETGIDVDPSSLIELPMRVCCALTEGRLTADRNYRIFVCHAPNADVQPEREHHDKYGWFSAAELPNLRMLQEMQAAARQALLRFGE